MTYDEILKNTTATINAYDCVEIFHANRIGAIYDELNSRGHLETIHNDCIEVYDDSVAWYFKRAQQVMEETGNEEAATRIRNTACNLARSCTAQVERMYIVDVIREVAICMLEELTHKNFAEFVDENAYPLCDHLDPNTEAYDALVH